ncbi:sensor histidine kinase [Actinomadura atramentaria]|uniref:sensor histidine kinase n=1 Tax=Actinomadura atramentaria TaxID=1990 RepID=UPI000374E7F0|nr:sensor histidine kinase [Actinomadura atramentaria]
MGTVADRPRAARAAPVIAAAAAGVVVAALVLGRWVDDPRRLVWWHPEIVVALLWTPVAGLLLRRRPRLAVGWLMLGAGCSSAVYVLSINLAPFLAERGAAGAGFFHWLSLWLWAVDDYSLTLVLPLIFPDGRLVSRWFAPVLALACAIPLIVCVHLTIDPDVLRYHNGVSAYPFQDIPLPISAAILACLVLGFVALGLRFARSAPDVRRQIVWVIYPGVFSQTITFLGESVPIHDAVRDGVVAAVPVFIAFAITKYRLYDIDLLVSRTIVYAALAAIITGVYFALVAAAGRIAADHLPVAGVVGAIVAGAVFEPVRRRLQRGVDRLIHGERDPYRIADRLNRRLQPISDPRAALTVAATTVRESLHAAGVVLEVVDRDGQTMSVTCGEPGERAQSVPLVWHSEPVGRLTLGVARRTDPRVAAVLARNLAELANATRLAIDVQRSRERILRTREEERRRLRRDLHDGLGPTLASLAMTADAARITMRADPDAAEGLLEQLRTTIGRTIGDIRDLVYGLRPPALDDLGLAGAIRALGGVVSTGDGPRVDVHVDGDLDRLPAAAEVAAYRIVQEALTNVYRHAKADRAVVRLLSLNGDLHVTVGDDGIGVRDRPRSGVGMTSMRERAAELGGSCTIGPGPGGGTLVSARLPVNGLRSS